jgi:hypothetical protein
MSFSAPRPSTAYVRHYLKYEVHCSLAQRVPAWVYAAIRERFDALIDEELDRPLASMAYDEVRKPLLRRQLNQLLSAPGYLMSAADEDALSDEISAKTERYRTTLVYEENQVEALAQEFASDNLADRWRHDLAVGHGFQLSGDRRWYLRGPLAVSPRNMGRAVDRARELQVGRNSIKPAP